MTATLTEGCNTSDSSRLQALCSTAFRPAVHLHTATVSVPACRAVSRMRTSRLGGPTASSTHSAAPTQPQQQQQQTQQQAQVQVQGLRRVCP